MDLFRPSTSRNIPTFKNLYIAERDLHDLAQMDTIVSKNIEVKTIDDQPVYIRTHFINIKDRKSKPILVILHGFAAAGCLYFTIWKMLSEVFCVIGLDIIGMGSSSRPNDLDFKKKNDPKVCLDYFIEYIELWRIQMGKVLKEELTKFILMGHSFGGY